MGLTWSLSAAIATVAILLIGGAIFNKMKTKQDSPLYRISEKIKSFKKEPSISTFDEKVNYKRIYHKSGLKW